VTLARTELRARVTCCRPGRLGWWGAALVKAIADKGEVESTGCLAGLVRRRMVAIDGAWDGCLAGQGWAGVRVPLMRARSSWRHCSVCWTWLNVNRCSPATPAAGAVTAGPSLASRRSGR